MFITFVRRHERFLVLSGLLVLAFTVSLDMFFDVKEGLPLEHLLHEALLLVFCLVLTLFQVSVISRQKKSLQSNQKEIQALTQSKEDFRLKSLRFSQDFSEAVAQQFVDWKLTESERDIAILLIKGLSMKEIAEDRQSKETTVRQQAASIYRKAQVEGRQDLTSFFLEDLFSPMAQK